MIENQTQPDKDLAPKRQLRKIVADEFHSLICRCGDDMGGAYLHQADIILNVIGRYLRELKVDHYGEGVDYCREFLDRDRLLKIFGIFSTCTAEGHGGTGPCLGGCCTSCCKHGRKL